MGYIRNTKQVEFFNVSKSVGIKLTLSNSKNKNELLFMVIYK